MRGHYSRLVGTQLCRPRENKSELTSSSKSPALHLNHEDFFLRVLTKREVPRLLGDGTLPERAIAMKGERGRKKSEGVVTEVVKGDTRGRDEIQKTEERKKQD